MKNSYIKPGQLVPAELRLEIYKEAKRSIEAKRVEKRYDVWSGSLHLLLESILYGTLSNRMYKKYYYQMFPEFTSDIDFIFNKKQALDELTKAIESLEKETSIMISGDGNKTCLNGVISFQQLTKQTVDSKGEKAIKTNIATRINENLNELTFDAALDVYNQIRDNMRERLAAEIAALEQPKNERLIYLKNLEL